jgi:Mlc titration factor MtfA (ptsG expression regulator)
VIFWSTKKRRKRLMDQPLPLGRVKIIRENVRYYKLLPPEDRKELEGLTQVFLDEKRYEGCGGLNLTDEIRVTIAAQACVLLLHREPRMFPHVEVILVYPTAYLAPVRRHIGDGIVAEGPEVRAGESWYRGSVVLSWEDVTRDLKGQDPGHNVVLHEFAHQLDYESGMADGTPLMEDPSLYMDWIRVFEDEYENLVEEVEQGFPTFLGEYAAVSPAEFFAVATECFFEIPKGMKRRHPELYELLTRFYQQDPALLLKAPLRRPTRLLH